MENVNKEKEYIRVICPDCGGTGESSPSDEDEENLHKVEILLCSTCKGKGFVITEKGK